MIEVDNKAPAMSFHHEVNSMSLLCPGLISKITTRSSELMCSSPALQNPVSKNAAVSDFQWHEWRELRMNASVKITWANEV